MQYRISGRPTNGPPLGLSPVPENQVVTKWFGQPTCTPGILTDPVQWAKAHASLLAQLNATVLIYQQRRLIDKVVQKCFQPYMDPSDCHKRLPNLTFQAYCSFTPAEQEHADQFNEGKRACSAKAQYGRKSLFTSLILADRILYSG